MDINNFSSDENSIKDDFVEREFLPKQNEELKENQMNDSKKGKELANKVIFDEEFEKAFNNVFNQKSKELPEIDDDQIMNISPFIQEKIPEHKNFVPPPKEKIIKSDLEKKKQGISFHKRYWTQ
jgi:carotenoid cleavage dioxygenase-like enzyme